MKVAERIDLIDGLKLASGSAIAPVLIKDPEQGLTLVDTGVLGSTPKIKEYIEQAGFHLRQIRRIIITHVHRDHTGSLKELVRETGAKTYAHWVEAPYIAQKPPYDGPSKSGLLNNRTSRD